MINFKSMAVTLLSTVVLCGGTQTMAMPATSSQIAQLEQATGLTPAVLTTAVKAYNYALTHATVRNHLLTIVNFDQPSTQKRLYTVNMDTDRLVFEGLVAHGQGSGDRYMATRFSNSADSHASSLGVFVTGVTYSGKHGTSLRINGLEKGLNSNAAARSVVVHAAPYVSDAVAQKTHGLGRSWGCFAVNPAQAPQLIQAIKGGSVLFAYADAEAHDPNLATV